MINKLISIRSIETNEFEKLIEFDNEYLQKAMFSAGVPQDQLAPLLTFSELEEAYKRDDYLKWIVIDGSLVGYFWLTKKTDYLYLSGVAIRPEFQGKGLVQYVLNLAESIAKEVSLSVIKLYVSPMNTRALNAYFKCGYQIVDTILTSFSSNNPKVFRVIMNKNLQDKQHKLLSFNQCEIEFYKFNEITKIIDQGYIGTELIKEKNNFTKILFIKNKDPSNHEVLCMQSNTIQINDIEMYYEVHGKGIPLLFLHGFTGSGAALAELFNDMTDEYQLIIPDIRGHGRSTNPSNVFTHRQASLDIETLLKHLNISKCIGIGFSCGGNILLQMAMRQTTLIEKMIIVSATPYYPNQAREIMRQFTVEGRSKEEWEAMRKIHLLGDEQIQMIWQQVKAMSASDDDMNFSPSDLAAIKVQTHIVQGDRDPLYPLDITMEMYQNIPGSSLWIIPNGGHGPITPFWMPIFKNYIKEIASSLEQSND